MDQLHYLLAFSRAIEIGNFSAVARDQAMTQSAVSKQIAMLESAWGIQLFRRTTRKLTPTAEALQLYPHVRQLLDAVDSVRSEVQGIPAGGEAVGTLRLAVPSSYGRNVIAPLLPLLLEAHPRLALDIVFTDGALDLIEEGLELAIQFGEVPTRTLVSRALGGASQLAVATPHYLAMHGTPDSPLDLTSHQCITASRNKGRTRWEFDSEHGRQAVELQAALTVNDLDAIRSATLAHVGIALVPDWLVHADIAAGSLVALMPEYYAPLQPIQIVYPQTRFLSRRARTFIDFLLQQLH